LKVKTRDGVIVVENVPENAVVEVDGDTVMITPVKGEPVRIEAPPGKHYVVVKRGDDLLMGQSVTLESGKSYSLSVRKEAAATHPPPPSVPPAEPAIAVSPKAGDHAQPSKPRAGPTPGGADLSPSPVPSAPEYVTRVGQIKLRLIPAGSFKMGSPDGEGEDDEHPQHAVRITRPFYLGVYEVTQAQYVEIMGSNPSYFSANGWGKEKVGGQSTDRHPVEGVSWLDAVKFCNTLSVKEGLEPFYKIEGGSVRVASWDGPGYRLPTEAEWEYACRAGPAGQGRYTFGDADRGLGEYAWFDGNSGGVTHPVGQKRPNRFGLFDMHGNVWELCQDWYDANYYKQSPTDDPRGPDAAALRVIRGASWGWEPVRCRSADRGGREPDDRLNWVGFRLALGQSGRSGPPGERAIAVTPKAGAHAEPSKPSAGPKPGGGDVAPSPLPSAPEHVTRVGQIKLRLIPAGSFRMGSPAGEGEPDERPQHPVRITRPFYLGLTEVTQAQYEEIMGSNPSWFSASGGGKNKVAGQSTDRHPAENVSWMDAVKFCNTLSEMERLKPFYVMDGGSARVPSWDGPGYRLPTEAEWEYACRGGPEGQGRYTFGDAEDGLGENAWFNEGLDKGSTHPVGRKRPNRFGLFDMHGNVWEWCQDWYDANYYKQSPTGNPRGPNAAAARVFRGGCWSSGAGDCRAAFRFRDGPVFRHSYLGFRLALRQSGR
jgi:formylglycine-generating enzyme required for sulfatase activity